MYVYVGEKENFLSFLLRERRRNGKNKFSFIKVNHCFNSGIVNDGKYFKYLLYKRFKIPGSEKFFVNDLYFSALDCPTSTKVTRIIIQERSIVRRRRNSWRISRKLISKRFLNLLWKQTHGIRIIFDKRDTIVTKQLRIYRIFFSNKPPSFDSVEDRESNRLRNKNGILQSQVGQE